MRTGVPQLYLAVTRPVGRRFSMAKHNESPELFPLQGIPGSELVVESMHQGGGTTKAYVFFALRSLGNRSITGARPARSPLAAGSAGQW